MLNEAETAQLVQSPGYGLDNCGIVVQFQARPRDFSLFHIFQTVSGPTQPLIDGLPRALSLALKRPERKAGHSPPSNREVKNRWCYKFSTPPPTSPWHVQEHLDFTYIK
jgi:hypothetical protein